MTILGVAKVHHSYYTPDEWEILKRMCTNLNVPFRAQTAHYDNWIEAFIVCTDNLMQEMEDVISDTLAPYI